MITILKSEERGHVKIDWLDSRHTFSFGDYYDPAHMSFHSLRVINEDHVAPASGFGAHPHRDMEIVTYVLQGVLQHKDNMGHGSLIHPGEIQRMSAGTGIVHSEFNHAESEPVHLLQIWITPEQKGIQPGYEQKKFSDEQKRNRFCLLASRDSRNGSVKIHQDVELWTTVLEEKRELIYEPRPNRHLWVQVAKGSIRLNEQNLNSGDAAAVEGETLRLQAKGESEILIFDLG